MSWERNVRKVEPYVPGEQPQRKVIKLNTNENPYPPSPLVTDAIQRFDETKLRLYPDPKAELLVDAWADYCRLPSDQVFVGVGSDDVLSIAFLTFFNGKKPVLFPDITYSFYDVWCDVYRIPYKTRALDENFAIVKEDYLTENGGIVIANPNAPTGRQEDLDFIEDIVRSNPDSVVIIDEAYVDFGAESALCLIDKYDNLLVVQTFSKSRAMAGLRIGFAMGNPKLIRYMNDVKFSVNSYTMNMPSIYYGIAAIQDQKYFETITGRIIRTRERMKRELHKLGFSFADSVANFIFVTHEIVPAVDIFEELKKNDIYVRHFNQDRIGDYLRITIGTDEEMDYMIEFLKKYLDGGSL